MSDKTTVSFAITTHNETDSFDRLLHVLLNIIDFSVHELVIADDHSSHPKTLEILKKAKSKGAKVLMQPLKDDFSAHKNALKTACSKEYIFSLDADEIPSLMLLRELDQILQHGSDAYALARVNIVEGITQKHIDRWNWSMNQEGWVNWPDWQVRLFRNTPEISWEGHVHEKVKGFKEFMYLPRDKGFALYHHKDISRQEQQNAFYAKLIERKFHKQCRQEDCI